MIQSINLKDGALLFMNLHGNFIDIFKEKTMIIGRATNRYKMKRAQKD